MDKEKEIEEIARMLGDCRHFSSCAKCMEATASKSCWDREKATILINAGYGNVKQYQEQIEKLEQELDARDMQDYQFEYQTDDETIGEARKQAVKEFAEGLKKKALNYYPSIDHFYPSQKAVNINAIDEFFKELYGEK